MDSSNNKAKPLQKQYNEPLRPSSSSPYQQQQPESAQQPTSNHHPSYASDVTYREQSQQIPVAPPPVSTSNTQESHSILSRQTAPISSTQPTCHTTAAPLQNLQHQEQEQQLEDVSAEHLTNKGDPLLAKWTSSFWRQTGKMQAAVGDLTGLESWQTQGRSTEAWADTAYHEAENRNSQGDPSWVRGEYDVIMGTLGNAVGYLAGDPEMQARARMRAHEGQDQVDRINRS